MKYSDCLAYRTLIAIARQRPGLDAQRCMAVFEQLDTSATLQTVLHRVLAEHRLSERKFAVLVVLFSLDPDPSTPADLAEHTGVSRSAITEALDQLARQRCIVRERADHDRRTIYIRLTATGRELLDRALMHYLRTAGDIARLLDRSSRTALINGCILIKKGAATHLPP